MGVDLALETPRVEAGSWNGEIAKGTTCFSTEAYVHNIVCTEKGRVSFGYESRRVALAARRLAAGGA
jgi:hypothetical protein